jgi:hypothetical protein
MIDFVRTQSRAAEKNGKIITKLQQQKVMIVYNWKQNDFWENALPFSKYPAKYHVE